jgi:hypothetical protein
LVDDIPDCFVGQLHLGLAGWLSTNSRVGWLVYQISGWLVGCQLHLGLAGWTTTSRVGWLVNHIS